jgi:hypothetical protein
MRKQIPIRLITFKPASGVRGTALARTEEGIFSAVLEDGSIVTATGAWTAMLDRNVASSTGVQEEEIAVNGDHASIKLGLRTLSFPAAWLMEPDAPVEAVIIPAPAPTPVVAVESPAAIVEPAAAVLAPIAAIEGQ